MQRDIGWLLAGLLLVAGAGCAEDAPVLSSRLDVQQEGWDALDVQVAFSERRGGTERPVESERIYVHVFDEAYDTLYAGPPGHIPVDDAALGDQERILVEACGVFASGSVCDQRAVTASPKRVTVAERIFYPEDSDFERGSYRFDFAVRRRAFDGSHWEPLVQHRPVEGYFLARVSGEPGTVVRVPITRTEGHFDLSRHEGFREFQYRLESAFYEGRDARVEFEVFAGLGGEPQQVAATDQWVHEMTEHDHEVRLASFLRQSAPQILDRLGTSEDAVVYVEEWSFDDFHDRYRVGVEIRWRDARSERYRLSGRLELTEDGRTVVFRRTGGNGQAKDLWAARMENETIRLDELLVGLEAEEWDLAEAMEREARGGW